MKALKILTLFFAGSIFLVNKIYAQQDYVITKKNDTIFCTIKGWRYRVNEKDKYTAIDSNITEYYTSEDSTDYVFKRDRIHNYQGFVIWFERGRINLYQRVIQSGGGMYGGYTYYYYYAGKGNDDLSLIEADNTGNRKELEKAFLDIFSDDFTLWEKFKNARKGDHSNEFILASVKEYNKAYASVDTNIWDYVITNKNDTVKCRLRYNKVLNDYLYKIKGKNDYITIDNADIKEYFFSRENITFKPIILPGQNKEVFVEWLERGRINLYAATKLTGDANNRAIKYYWYVNKGDGPLIPIKIDAEYIYDLRAHKDELAAFRDVISDDKNALTEFNDNFKRADTNTDMATRYYIRKYNDDYSESHKTSK